MRICLRMIPGWFGFHWWQIILTKGPFTVEHFWAVRNIARSHRFGPLLICTMRKDCVERADWSRP